MTPDDIIRYNKAQIRRANCNLVNAEKRGDTVAAANIKHKIELYQYTIEVAQYYKVEQEDIEKKIAEAGNAPVMQSAT